MCPFDNVKSVPKELRTDDPCHRVGDEWGKQPNFLEIAFLIMFAAN